MTAVGFLFLAFVFTIANRLYAKHTLNKYDVFAVTILSNAVCAVVLFPFFLQAFPTTPSLLTSQMMLIAFLGFLWAIAAWTVNASVAMNDFSFKEIIRQTRVVWVVLAGVLLLGEQLGPKEAVGITFIIASVFIISYKRISFREHISSRPILLAWFSAALVAFITVLEKILLMNTEVLTYALFAFLLPSIFLVPFLNKKRLLEVRGILDSHKRELLIFSILMLGAYYTGISAYKLLPISIAYPVIQSSTVFGVLIGTALFEQSQHLGKKVLAAVIAVIGVLIIQFW